MAIPEPILDDLRFQKDLVDEARRRIIRYCPEWTDYNLSDPGITLIELFAWMTEMITYRLNLVPEKNYVRFMDLLGVQPRAASSARTELTFRLSARFPLTPGSDVVAFVPQGTEVATRVTTEEPEVTFTTDERLLIVPPKLTQLRTEDDFNKNYVPRLGIEIFHCFKRKPEMGDTFYLGFDEAQDLKGHILQLDFTAEETQATGVRRSDPPWVWECSIGDGQWAEVPLSNLPSERDTTGGLNNPEGSLTLYLPLTVRPDAVHGRTAYWLRCRIEQRRPEQGMYTQSPRIVNVAAYSLGATTPATHAVNVIEEIIGTSSGEPGQVFHLQHAPVLALRDGETIEVEEWRDREWVFIPWQAVDDFAHSDRHDRHFTLDTSTGEVRFGPAIRQPDGAVRQYGRVPEADRLIRISRYRHGGGIAGNVPIGKVQVLKTTIPYIAEVSNLKRAEGGRDPESLDELKQRARREVRAQQRAVTAEDYEVLAKGASRSIARVKCVTPSKNSNLPPGMIELLVVPAAFDALRHDDRSKLYLSPDMMKAIDTHLDQYRLLTTTIRVREPKYIGVKTMAEIVLTDYAQPEIVRARAIEALRNFISPLAIGDAGDLASLDWEGWPFGRDLFVSEVYSLIQRVPGVKHVLDVKLSQRPVNPGKEVPIAGDDEGEAQAQPQVKVELPLTPIEQRRFAVDDDTLLCSLEHEIKITEL
jgi:predicted phage baseplate assembly protein